MRWGLACAAALWPPATNAPRPSAAMPPAKNSRRPMGGGQQVQRPNRVSRSSRMVSARDSLSLRRPGKRCARPRLRGPSWRDLRHAVKRARPSPACSIGRDAANPAGIDLAAIENAEENDAYRPCARNKYQLRSPRHQRPLDRALTGRPPRARQRQIPGAARRRCRLPRAHPRPAQLRPLRHRDRRRSFRIRSVGGGPLRPALAAQGAARRRWRRLVRLPAVGAIRAQISARRARAAVVASHRPGIRRGAPHRELLRQIHPGGAGRRHGRGVRARSLPGAHRGAAGKPRGAHGDGPENVHRRHATLARAIRQRRRAADHRREREGFELAQGPDLHHPRQRQDPQSRHRRGRASHDRMQRAARSFPRLLRRRSRPARGLGAQGGRDGRGVHGLPQTRAGQGSLKGRLDKPRAKASAADTSPLRGAREKQHPMKRSIERILTTHTGSLPRPPPVVELMLHEQSNPGAKAAELQAAVRRAVADVVAKQVACGLDVINDGEQGRTDYTTHVKDRLTGFDGPSFPPLGTGEPDFPELSAMLAYFASPFQHRPACSGPVEWKDFAALEADIALAKEATASSGAADVFFPSPGQIARYLKNQHYPSEEAYLYALADVMAREYRAIVDAGLVLQLDCPDLALSRHMVFAHLSLEEFRR